MRYELSRSKEIQISDELVKHMEYKLHSIKDRFPETLYFKIKFVHSPPFEECDIVIVNKNYQGRYSVKKATALESFNEAFSKVLTHISRYKDKHSEH